MRNLTTFFFLLVFSMMFAQRNADKTLEFDSKVKDLIIVPFNGIAAISDNSQIYGYNPEEKTIIWTKPIPKASALSVASGLAAEGITPEALLSMDGRTNGADFTVIPDTPFLIKFFDNRLYVINSFNGDLILEPKDENVFFYQAEYLFDEDAFLIRGVEDKKLIVSKFDIKSKSFIWKTVVSENFTSFLGKLSSILGDDPTAGRDFMTYTDKKVFILAKSKFYSLNKDTGALLWSEEEEDHDYFYTSADGKHVLLTETKGLLGSKTEMDLRNGDTGEAIWKDPIRSKYLVLFEDWQDKMLLAHYKGFNFYDYQTGEKIWKKDPKGKGIKSVIPIGTDFLYVYDDEMMLIDKEGQKKWKKDVKISDNEEDPIFFLEKTGNGKILYVTATYANLVDYNTGDKIWKKNLKLNEKRPTFAKFDEKSGNFVIYNDEELYKFNESSAERPEPYAELKLKNEKLITSMEIFPNNVSITGQSEVVGVDDSGKVIFHNKYKQPGEFGRRLAKSALIAGKVVGSIAAAEITVTTTHKDANGNEVTTVKGKAAVFGQKAKAIGEAGYIAGNFTQQFVQERFNALQETDENAILFVKGENDEKLLVKIDKQTGNETDKITVDNNKPIYDYDAVTGDLYYSIGNNVKIFNGQ